MAKKKPKVAKYSRDTPYQEVFASTIEESRMTPEQYKAKKEFLDSLMGEGMKSVNISNFNKRIDAFRVSNPQRKVPKSNEEVLKSLIKKKYVRLILGGLHVERI